jgi:hypothetical protein
LTLGNNPDDAILTVNNMIREEEKTFDNFVEQNPEVLLPDNLEVNVVDCGEPVELSRHVKHETPERSFEDQATAQAWTEVVKKGRNKTRSKSEKINTHDRHILEY